ncbi:hypothetical protein AB6A40_010272 [Gnathostoma spinigerum]|uniref:Uncharacterized protein n=1 Tax=Gnathostoma spinigerum TaxID=75299 RepID=A0ABD6F1F3_9BILA
MAGFFSFFQSSSPSVKTVVDQNAELIEEIEKKAERVEDERFRNRIWMVRASEALKGVKGPFSSKYYKCRILVLNGLIRTLQTAVTSVINRNQLQTLIAEFDALIASASSDCTDLKSEEFIQYGKSLLFQRLGDYLSSGRVCEDADVLSHACYAVAIEFLRGSFNDTRLCASATMEFVSLCTMMYRYKNSSNESNTSRVDRLEHALQDKRLGHRLYEYVASKKYDKSFIDSFSITKRVDPFLGIELEKLFPKMWPIASEEDFFERFLWILVHNEHVLRSEMTFMNHLIAELPLVPDSIESISENSLSQIDVKVTFLLS